MKRVVAVLIAACLTFALGTATFAAGNGNGKSQGATASGKATGNVNVNAGQGNGKTGNGNNGQGATVSATAVAGTGAVGTGTGAGTGTGNGTGTGTGTGTGNGANGGNNAACVGKKGQTCPPPSGGNTTINGVSCDTTTQQCMNPASGACVSNHGQYVSATTGHRPAGSPPNQNRTCTNSTTTGTTPAGGTVSQVSGSTTGTPAAPVRSNYYAPRSNVPAVVPSGATTVGQVQTAAGNTVTYLGSNGVYYHVTYAPNGSYTYTSNYSPGVLGAYSGVTPGSYSSPGVMGAYGTAPGVMGAYGSAGGAYGTAGINSMPVTGGGRAPALPALPLFFGIVLVLAGAATRRFALVRQ